MLEVKNQNRTPNLSEKQFQRQIYNIIITSSQMTDYSYENTITSLYVNICFCFCNSRTLAAFRSVAVRQLISRLVSCASCMAGDLWSRIDRLSFGQLSSRGVSDFFADCTNRPCSRVAVTNGLMTGERVQLHLCQCVLVADTSV